MLHLAVIAARRSRWDGKESSVAQPEPRSDAELALSEISHVFQDRATILQHVGAEQRPQPWGVIRRPLDAQTKRDFCLGGGGGGGGGGGVGVGCSRTSQ